jgi:5'-3' exonuclease
MGIPAYFSLIIRNYKNIVKTLDTIPAVRHNNSAEMHHLFMDCNSIVYDAFHEFEDDITFSEEALIEMVLKTIHSYIVKMKPSKTIFIAFDGVAPMAKMVQQRERRYKSAHLSPQKASSSSVSWSTSNITPGTAFMGNLTCQIRNRFTGKECEYGVQTIVISTPDIVGEGEQKIFQYLRTIPDASMDECVVYGLDADLIMLSLLHVDLVKNIWVCREAPEFMKDGTAYTFMKGGTNKNNLLCIDVKYLTECIFHHISHGKSDSNNVKRRVVDDYIFLCFFLGNDFLPHFPSLNIRTRGMDVLIDIYRTHLGNKYLTDIQNRRIVWKNVYILFHALVKIEHELFLQEHASRDKLMKRLSNDKVASMDTNNLPILYRSEEMYICPKEFGWQKRYYKALFEEDVEITDICQNFIEGLEWVMQYYTLDCPDWSWKYKYHYPPLFQDLVVHGSHKTRVVWNSQSVPLLPIEQLKYVLPKSQYSLIPVNDVDAVDGVVELQCPLPNCSFAYCRNLWETHVS